MDSADQRIISEDVTINVQQSLELIESFKRSDHMQFGVHMLDIVFLTLNMLIGFPPGCFYANPNEFSSTWLRTHEGHVLLLLSVIVGGFKMNQRAFLSIFHFSIGNNQFVSQQVSRGFWLMHLRTLMFMSNSEKRYYFSISSLLHLLPLVTSQCEMFDTMKSIKSWILYKAIEKIFDLCKTRMYVCYKFATKKSWNKLQTFFKYHYVTNTKLYFHPEYLMLFLT